MSKPAEILKEAASLTAEDLNQAVTIPVEAYISEDYVRAERDKLWRKVWLQVGRLEDLPEVGSYLNFDILDDSIVVVRTAADKVKAYHNVCPHRGRRLVDTPSGQRNAHGKKKMFICAYHGWRFNLDGANTHIPLKGRLAGMSDRGKHALERGQARHVGRLDLDQHGSALAKPCATIWV